MNHRHLAVIGAGGWGTALARLIAKKGFRTVIWANEEDTVSAINENHENTFFLPGVALPDNLKATACLEMALDNPEAIIMAVPSRFVRTVAAQCNQHWRQEYMVINAGKGLEPTTGKTLSRVLLEEIGELTEDSVAVLSGPNHAEEVGRDIPSASVAAAYDLRAARFWQELLATDFFRIYTNQDVLGVELAGALKNVVAVAAGICDGIGYGDNTKAAVITRGIAEITRLGKAMGAHPMTFAGLSGLGDLFATAGSHHSRNRWAGEQLGKGKTYDEICGSTRMVIEGFNTVSAALKLAKTHGVEMPLTEKVNDIIAQRCSPSAAVASLMRRELVNEIEPDFIC